jgi:hypothetical protein
LLWLLLVVFFGWAGFTVYTIAIACRELYYLGRITPFVPGLMLGAVALVFAAWALFMVAGVALSKIETEIHKWDGVFRQADLSKRRMSVDRSA